MRLFAIPSTVSPYTSQMSGSLMIKAMQFHPCPQYRYSKYSYKYKYEPWAIQAVSIRPVSASLYYLNIDIINYVILISGSGNTSIILSTNKFNILTIAIKFSTFSPGLSTLPGHI